MRGELRVQELKSPVTVKSIATRDVPAWRAKLLFGGECGDMVAVRPVAEQYGGRTFLGILIGEIAQAVDARITAEGQIQVDPTMHNPAIFVPDLNTVIFGISSWWGRIRDAEQLRQITDEDISNVWYVRALEQIAKDVAADEAEEAAGGTA